MFFGNKIYYFFVVFSLFKKLFLWYNYKTREALFMNENKKESIDNIEESSDANTNQKSHNSSQTKKHILITWLIATGVLFTLFLINIFIIKFDMGLNSKLDNFSHP